MEVSEPYYYCIIIKSLIKRKMRTIPAENRNGTQEGGPEKVKKIKKIGNENGGEGNGAC
jgi:hypothetical protein